MFKAVNSFDKERANKLVLEEQFEKLKSLEDLQMDQLSNILTAIKSISTGEISQKINKQENKQTSLSPVVLQMQKQFVPHLSHYLNQQEIGC